MKIAYLILAHNNPGHLSRMIAALSHQDCSFFVHIDGKSNIDDFRHINGDKVHFIENRLDVYWGEYSMVEAILALIRQALAAVEGNGYLVLLSGSDYPLRSNEYINGFFERMYGTQFISMVEIPDGAADQPLSKINRFSPASSRPICRFFARALGRIGLASRDYRKHLGILRPFVGSTWWALTADACRYILEFVEHNRSICNYFENTFSSDEMLFHTILATSTFSPRVHRSLVYADWSDRGPHPAMIAEGHLVMFERSEKFDIENPFGRGELLFARKFSENSRAIIDRIDEMIHRKDPGANCG
jgi:hypothetical protein